VHVYAWSVADRDLINSTMTHGSGIDQQSFEVSFQSSMFLARPEKSADPLNSV
jgi:hypothetical protein